ncbi:MAG: aldehyde dehydrogenase (NADP(+)) [Planctomycetes bacterium]|nr:aldehyde dehydrogenase (NADP(+)) [Planctomycetota bacterium]
MSDARGEPGGALILGGARPWGRGAAYRAEDPRDGTPLGPEFRDADAAQVHEACTLAAEAAPGCAAVGPERRAAFLRGIAAELLGLGDALLARAGRETALPPGRLMHERARTVRQLELFADVVAEGSWVDARIDRGRPGPEPAARPDLRRMLVPLGPVAVFGASNFPLAFSVAGGDTASALAAGCPVVVKAHPYHPGTSELAGEAIARAAARAGLPEGTFALLHGRAHAVGAALVQHPAIAAVAFTGSERGGRALFDLAMRRPRPVPMYAEMGSSNPVFVLPGALAEGGAALAGRLAASVALGVGQFCTNPGLIVLPDDGGAAPFVAALAAALGACAPGTMVHRELAAGYARALAELRAIPGVHEVARAAAVQGAPAVAPAALLAMDATAWLAAPRAQAEVYGPATIVVRCASQAAMLAVAHALPGQLTASVHAGPGDEAAARALADVLATRAGRLVFAGVPTGVEVCAAMQHGGPYPASTDPRVTSVGTAALLRFVRPLCLQDAPAALLPPELQEGNPRGILRMVDGAVGRD